MQKYCRFCLAMCDETISDIKQDIRDMMEMVLPEMLLTITGQPAICNQCEVVLRRCFNFKSVCFNTENFILKFINQEGTVLETLDLKDLYMRTHNLFDHNLLKNGRVCRFCMKLVEDGSLISLAEEDDNLLQNCVNLVNLKLTMDAVICGSCHQSLKCYSNFIDNCMKTEGNINKLEEINIKEEIVSDENVASFSNCDESKMDLVNRSCEDEDIKMVLQDSEEFVKMELCTDELIIEAHIGHPKVEQTEEYGENIRENMVEEDKPETEQEELQRRQSESRENNLKKPALKHKNSSSVRCNRESHCPECGYKTTNKKSLKMHLLKCQMVPSRPKKYCCQYCNFAAVSTTELKNHMAIHKDTDMQLPSTSTVADNVENLGQSSKKSVCECAVCILIIKRFSSLNFADELQLITGGRTKPPMKNLTTKMKNCIRHFYPEQHYEQFKWLTGCETVSKLFCWPCLLFGNEKGLWNETGFSDLNNFHRAVKRHVISEAHLRAIIQEKVFGKTRIEHALNKQLEISHRQHNDLVDKNRQVLKRLIDVVCFLGQRESRYRGRDDDETRVSSDRGSFQDLLSLMARYDDRLRNHIERSTVFLGNSHRIQNDLISAVATIILNRIKQEIGEARFIAIILDATTDDSTNFSHLAIVIRYVAADGSIEERFLGFKDLSENRTADALYTAVYNVTREINGDKRLVAQSYDGAAVTLGQLEGLQAKVRETFPTALFVHCVSHKLNLVLSQSINHIKECKMFFVALSGMASFFSKSTKRTQALDTIARKRSPKVALTSWNCNGRLVLAVSENRESLIELFENIIENNETWDSEAINSSRGFLDCLKRDFNFNYLLNIFSEIFPFSDNVFDILQTRTNDIAFCVKTMDDFKSMLSQIRNDFDLFWEKTLMSNIEPQAKHLRTDKLCDIQTSYRRLFYEIVDNIQQQINCRFNGLNDLKFLELCNFDAFKGNTFPEDAFKSLLLHYGQFFDRVLLRSELKVIYETDDISSKNNAQELMQFLKDKELEDAYTEVSKLCEIVLTIPATSAAGSSVERTMSTIERIKNFVGNSTVQERLSQISLLSIENKLLRQMSEHRRFYDDVIDEFAKSDTRIELHYK